MKKKTKIILVGCGVTLALFAALYWYTLGDGLLGGREYLDDICIPLDGRDGELVIREWSFLLGGGAEIYYRQSGKMTMLGQTSGGDDGYCPFDHGKYSVTVEGDTVVIRWANRGSEPEEEWREDTFTLPLE